MSAASALSGKTAVVTGASSGIGRAIATNFARNFDPEFVAGFAKAAGVEIEVKRGQRLPDEVLDRLQPAMRKLLGSPEDVAEAVLFAVTQPIHVNVAEIVVRPPKQLNL